MPGGSTDPAARRAQQEEGDDLEDPLPVPGVHVAHVTELPVDDGAEAGLLEGSRAAVSGPRSPGSIRPFGKAHTCGR